MQSGPPENRQGPPTGKAEAAKESGGHRKDEGVTRRVKELEEEIERLKSMDSRVAPPIDRNQAMKQLKDMGLMPTNLPNNLFDLPSQGTQDVIPNENELRRMGMETGDVTGKPFEEIPFNNEVCVGCSDRQKLKSDKYVKTNVNIKVQEQWPHMNMLRKYSRRVPYDQLEFEAFVGGETRTILQMKDPGATRKWLELLSTVSHWVCCSKDWPLVLGLYEAVLESIGLGG